MYNFVLAISISLFLLSCATPSVPISNDNRPSAPAVSKETLDLVGTCAAGVSTETQYRLAGLLDRARLTGSLTAGMKNEMRSAIFQDGVLQSDAAKLQAYNLYLGCLDRRAEIAAQQKQLKLTQCIAECDISFEEHKYKVSHLETDAGMEDCIEQKLDMNTKRCIFAFNRGQFSKAELSDCMWRVPDSIEEARSPAEKATISDKRRSCKNDLTELRYETGDFMQKCRSGCNS